MSASAYDRQMKWKRHGEKKLLFESRRLEEEKLEECTFSPQTNKVDVKRVIELGKLTKKSEVHAMQVHVTRQQRARVQSDESLKKYDLCTLVNSHQDGRQAYTPVGKNYEEVTECKPFNLSKGNKARRESIPLTKQRAHSESPKKSTQEIRESNDLDKQVRDVIDNNKGSDGVWERERASLISIIEAQRNEIKTREKSQQEAAKIADKFATAVLAFEERLLAVEQKSKAEVSELRKAMDRQQTYIISIMQAMGIQLDEGKVHETRVPRQLLFRKEYEKSNA